MSVAITSCSPAEQTSNNESKPAAQAKTQELIPARAGHLVALDMAPLFVRVESGCFKKNGLAVETVFFTNPGDNNAALAGGAINVSTNSFTMPFFAANSGVPIQTVSATGGWGVMQVIAKREYGIESVADLAKYVAANPNKKLRIATLRGDTLELILLDALKQGKLSVNDVEMVYFDDLLAMVDAFKLGEVEMLSHIKPYTTQFVQGGDATVVTDNAETWSPTVPNTVVSVLEQRLKQRPEVVQADLKGLQCAAAIINQSPEAAIARSLAVRPDILLLDEPFSALDIQLRRRLQNFLLSIWQEISTTMTLVTHSVEEAIFLGQRLIVVGDCPGRIIEDVSIAASEFRDRYHPVNSGNYVRCFSGNSVQPWHLQKAWKPSKRCSK